MTWRSIELADETYGFAERPAFGHGVIAASYSASSSEPGAWPVVGVFDVDGSPGFTLTIDANGREIETCEPCVDDRGVVRAAAYEHDIELVVVAAFIDGSLLPRTSLGSEYPIAAADMGSKLRTQIVPCHDGGFVVSWSYRARQLFVGKYRDGIEQPVWSAPEWIVGATREHVLCATELTRRGQRDSERLVCRRMTDGEIEWELDSGGEVDVGATLPDAFLLVDRSQRFAEKRALAATAEQAFLDDIIAQSEVEAAWDAMPTAPTIVRLVDATSGETRWALPCEGDVFAAHLSPDGLASIMTTDAARNGRLHLLRHDPITHAPNARTAIAVPGHESSSWPPSIGHEPVIVAHVNDHVIWADTANVHATTLGRAGPTTELLFALPCSIGGFRPRSQDRSIAKANAVVGAGHLYLRCGRKLWIAPLPEFLL